MRLYQTRVRKTNKEIRPTRSPLKPFTIELNWKLLQLKGNMTVLQGMCRKLEMYSSEEYLQWLQGQLEKMLREQYQIVKQGLVDRGLYPKKGMYDQRTLDRQRMKRNGL